MFDALEAAVADLEIPLHGAALAAAIRLHERLGAAVAAAIGDFDRVGLWEVEGATSMTAWLRDRAGLDRRRAAGMRATGRRLVALPEVTAAARSGELSGGQVQAIVSAVSDQTVGLFAEQEAELVPRLAVLSVADTIDVLSAWRARAEALLDDGEPHDEPLRSLHHSRTLGDRWEGTWSLDAEGGAVVDKAIQLATTGDLDGDPVRTAAQRRADALVDICRHLLDHQQTRKGGRHRPHLDAVLHLDGAGHPASAEIVDGPALSETSMRRLLCDCTFHTLVVDADTTTLRYGRATRAIPAPLWSGLVVRDRHCRFPGCDRPPHWCEGHHVHPWEHGGRTDPDNLVLLCSRHHHLVHKTGWQAKLLPSADLEVTLPDGTVRTSAPPGRLHLRLGDDPPGERR
jgi:hypothetical protein